MVNFPNNFMSPILSKPLKYRGRCMSLSVNSLTNELSYRSHGSYIYCRYSANHNIEIGENLITSVQSRDKSKM